MAWRGEQLTAMDDDAQLDLHKPCELRYFLEIIDKYDGDDPLLPWLCCLRWIKTSLPTDGFSYVYRNLLDLCTKKFSRDLRYCSDTRYLQIWIQFADCCDVDAESVFKRMEALQIGQDFALFYGAYAICLEAQNNVLKAHTMYQLGISRQAKPVGLLEEAYKSFLKRVANCHRFNLTKDAKPSTKSPVSILGINASAVNNGAAMAYRSLQSTAEVQTSRPLQDLTNIPNSTCDITSLESMNKIHLLLPSTDCREIKGSCGDPLAPSTVNPWESNLFDRLLSGLKPPLAQYQDFHRYPHKHKGASLASLKCAPHNKVLELDSKRYHLKGCTGQGAFAQVFKACEEQDKENIVVLKIQRPPCPWEFYIYSQLNKRIPQEERASYGRAWKMHVYGDCSIMVCAYGERGTLQDVVNSYLAIGQRMDELLCMYYTVEMLRMLEVLHSTGIIHGDFKPDNLLIRNQGEILEDWAPERPGCWIHQGLCLIDWGRSIDLNLLAPGTLLEGDCKTSGFQCVEMQQQKPWTFQVDTYGLCCIVHVMLYGSYMEIEAEANSYKMQSYRPKVSFKRYHKSELWGELFSRLLNVKSCLENPSLMEIRSLFESYLTSNTHFPKKIKELMVRQSKIMCSKN
ncbi:hypothetical protein L7F22_048310 [Adiantum nelumboides]|nr:hypothetical protein [Adiantum nelumboides]